MGVLLRGVKREQLKRGQIIAIPGSIKAVKQFQAQLYVLTSDEGLLCRAVARCRVDTFQAGATHHSSPTTARNSSFGLLMSPRH